MLVAGVAFVFVLPRLASYGEVWRRIDLLSTVSIVGLVAAAVFNVGTFALPWMVALPGFGFVRALRFTQASTAFSLVVPAGAPLGMAASFAMLRSLGISQQAAGLAVAVTGIWNQLSSFIFPVLGLGLLAAERQRTGWLEWPAVLGVLLLLAAAAVLAFLLASGRLATRLGNVTSQAASRLARFVGKGPVARSGVSFTAFRAEMLGMLRVRWRALTLATLANQLTNYLVLELALHSVGIGVGLASAPRHFAAWSVGRLLGSFPITPGGAGLIELGLAGALVSLGGHGPQVVAGVLLYRGLTTIPTVVLGTLAGATWRIRSRRPTPPAD